MCLSSPLLFCRNMPRNYKFRALKVPAASATQSLAFIHKIKSISSQCRNLIVQNYFIWKIHLNLIEILLKILLFQRFFEENMKIAKLWKRGSGPFYDLSQEQQTGAGHQDLQVSAVRQKLKGNYFEGGLHHFSVTKIGENSWNWRENLQLTPSLNSV